jgi:ribonucleotide monophosphatase NagD (HAD superfamily)
MRSLDIFRLYDIVLCDIDGVLHTGREGIAGVPELLALLGPSGPTLVFLTNNGSSLPEQIVAWLAQMGLEIPVASLVTAGQVLADAFQDHGRWAPAQHRQRAGGRVHPARWRHSIPASGGPPA